MPSRAVTYGSVTAKNVDKAPTVTDLIRVAMQPPPEISPARQARYEDQAGELVSILDGVADPNLATAIQNWILSEGNARAKNSMNAFLADLRVMAPLFRANKLMLVPARPAALAQYIDKIATDLAPVKPATIARRMASIALLHKAANIAAPTRSQIVRDALARHRQVKGTKTRQATPLRTADVKQILAMIGTTPADLRDRAMILIAHDTGLRASELLNLQVEHIQSTDQGWGRLFLAQSKGGVAGQAISITFSKTALNAVEDWLEAVAITKGPLFRGFDMAGTLREGALSRQSYDRIIKFRASQIGLEQGISAHSSRVGFAQDLLEKGASHSAVMTAGRWKSVGMVLHYGEQIETEPLAAIQRFLDE